MKTIIKTDTRIHAFQLGTGSTAELDLIEQHKIVPLEDGTYEVYSTESAGKKGEIAQRGDYIKVDHDGNPYPICQTLFESEHVPVRGDIYLQKVSPLEAWEYGTPADNVIDWILRQHLLEINAEDPRHYYHARLWGTDLYQSRDALVVIYSVVFNPDSSIASVDFNLLSRSEFNRTYRYL